MKWNRASMFVVALVLAVVPDLATGQAWPPGAWGRVQSILGQAQVIATFQAKLRRSVLSGQIGSPRLPKLHLTIWKAVIRIITIEREYGCGAAGIAQKLAARLHWTLRDQLLTQEIARLAHCEQSAIEKREERRDPLYYRLLKSFALGSYEGSPGVPVETLDADSIVRISERVVEQAAAAGNCVIVGRGSQQFLRARSDTLRFFLYASREEKLRRLISEGKTQADAETLVDTVDGERAAFIKEYFHAEWPNRSVYHAMVNTGAGDETVVQAILSFLQQTLSTRLAAD